MRASKVVIVAVAAFLSASVALAEEPVHSELQVDFRARGKAQSENSYAINYHGVLPLFEGRRLVPGVALQIQKDIALAGAGPAWFVRRPESRDNLELSIMPLAGTYRTSASFLSLLQADVSFYTPRMSGRLAASFPLWGGRTAGIGLRYDADALMWPFAYAGGGARISSESGTGPMLAGGLPDTRLGRGWLSISWLPLPAKSGSATDVRRWLLNVTLVH